MKPYKRSGQYTTYLVFHPCLETPSVFIKHLNKTLSFLPIGDCVKRQSAGSTLTSKWDTLSRKGASVPNQALLDRDLLSHSDHMKRCLVLARVSAAEGQENRHAFGI